MPTLRAIILNTDPIPRDRPPRNQVTEQKIGLFLLITPFCYLTCAYFIITNPNVEKKLPNEARNKHYEVSAALSGNFALILAVRPLIILGALNGVFIIKILNKDINVKCIFLIRFN